MKLMVMAMVTTMAIITPVSIAAQPVPGGTDQLVYVHAGHLLDRLGKAMRGPSTIILNGWALPATSAVSNQAKART